MIIYILKFIIMFYNQFVGYLSYYFLFKLGDNLHELNQNSPLLDQVVLADNLNDVSGTASQDQLVLYANVDAQQNVQRETESSSNSRVIYNIYNAASHERIVEAEESIIVAAPIQMVYMPDSNQETVVTESQDECQTIFFQA